MPNVINLNRTISLNILLLSFILSCTYAISLCPYIATPSEPKSIKYVVIDNV